VLTGIEGSIVNEIITCPACQNKVQLPQEFLGRAVQCPECKHTFMAGGVTMPPTSVTSDPFTNTPTAPSGEREPVATPRRPRYAVDDDADDEPFDDWGHRQRALRPDRGGMILAFGILTIMAPCFLGLIFGPLAWFMGSSDLAAIDSGEMNPSNRGLVQAGRIIGGIGFLLQVFSLVAVGAYFVFLSAMVRH
jgi:hypothetical protein